MSVVYVKEQGAVVRKRGARILVEKDRETLAEVLLRTTESVGLFGSVQVTTQALSELLDRGIPLALYTRHGRLKGHLVPAVSKNAALRIEQYRAALAPARALEIARAAVRAKLHNSVSVLLDFQSNYTVPELPHAVAVIRGLSAATAQACALPELLGIEGAAAASYFGALAVVNRSDLPFDGRRKHPATDPINSLLGLGYTMAMNELRSLAEGAGLEPHLGFLHAVDYGRPSLALDLLEPFRAPFVDRLTWTLVNCRVVTGADFARRAAGPRAGSVVLAPDAFARYLEAYEAAATKPRCGAPDGFRSAMAKQVESMCRDLREGIHFQPFLEVNDALRDLL